jgi:SHS2 domain-containing protein
MSEGFEEVDHTADLGLRVRAASLEGLFLRAALGLASLLTDPAAVGSAERATIEVRGIDLEELLVAWLNELLYRFESKRLVLTAFPELRIERGGEGHRLLANGTGGRWDPQRHPPGAPIKAATYHGLKIVPAADGGFEITLIFDT